MNQDMRRFVEKVYLNGTIRQALERTFSGDEADAILEMLRRGIGTRSPEERWPLSAKEV